MISSFGLEPRATNVEPQRRSSVEQKVDASAKFDVVDERENSATAAIKETETKTNNRIDSSNDSEPTGSKAAINNQLTLDQISQQRQFDVSTRRELDEASTSNEEASSAPIEAKSEKQTNDRDSPSEIDDQLAADARKRERAADARAAEHRRDIEHQLVVSEAEREARIARQVEQADQSAEKRLQAMESAQKAVKESADRQADFIESLEDVKENLADAFENLQSNENAIDAQLKLVKSSQNQATAAYIDIETRDPETDPEPTGRQLLLAVV